MIQLYLKEVTEISKSLLVSPVTASASSFWNFITFCSINSKIPTYNWNCSLEDYGTVAITYSNLLCYRLIMIEQYLNSLFHEKNYFSNI